MYFPIALVLGVMFTAFNTLFVPISLLNQLVRMLLKVFDSSASTPTCQKLAEVPKFMFFGTFHLLVSLILDPIKFVYNLYTDKEADIFTCKDGQGISMTSFNRFEEVCQEIIVEQKELLEDPNDLVYIDFV